jgi:hypothetical protein
VVARHEGSGLDQPYQRQLGCCDPRWILCLVDALIAAVQRYQLTAMFVLYVFAAIGLIA